MYTLLCGHSVVYTLEYLGTTPGYVGSIRVNTRITPEYIPYNMCLLIVGYIVWGAKYGVYPGVSGRRTWLRWSYPSRYPGTSSVYTLLCALSRVHTLGHPGATPGCAGHTRVDTWVPADYVP